MLGRVEDTAQHSTAQAREAHQQTHESDPRLRVLTSDSEKGFLVESSSPARSCSQYSNTRKTISLRRPTATSRRRTQLGWETLLRSWISRREVSGKPSCFSLWRITFFPRGGGGEAWERSSGGEMGWDWAWGGRVEGKLDSFYVSWIHQLYIAFLQYSTTLYSSSRTRPYTLRKSVPGR